MKLEVKDLAGFSQPLTKLIEVVSAAVGAHYRPRAMRAEADARAYEIKAIARAEAEAATETKNIQIAAVTDRIQKTRVRSQFPLILANIEI